MILIETKRPGFITSTKSDVRSKTELCHTLAEKVFQDRLLITFQITNTTNTVGVFCTVSDTLTGEQLTRLGEVPADTESPIKGAYEKAFVSAVESFLDIRIVKVNEKDAQEAQDVQEENTAPQSVLPDTAVILFGNLKGKTFGDVKETPQFIHFLEQLQNTPSLRFDNDAAKQEQLEALRKITKGVTA